MQVSSLTSLPLATAGIRSTAGTSQFKDTLTQATETLAARRKQADEGAKGLVADALILPILKQIRQSTFNTDGPFSPGNGEKAFGPQFDMQLADRIAQSPNLGITKALSDRLMKRGMPRTALTKGMDVHG